MRKLLKMLFWGALCMCIFSAPVSAGKPLNVCKSYKEFGVQHHEAIKAMFKDYRSIADHKIEMVYPETAKKSMPSQD